MTQRTRNFGGGYWNGNVHIPIAAIGVHIKTTKIRSLSHGKPTSDCDCVSAVINPNENCPSPSRLSEITYMCVTLVSFRRYGRCLFPLPNTIFPEFENASYPPFTIAQCLLHSKTCSRVQRLNANFSEKVQILTLNRYLGAYVSPGTQICI